MKTLRFTQFGNPILRQPARCLNVAEIKHLDTQSLIKNMRQTLVAVKLGVGLAAPQVGRGVAIATIVIQPTEHRPKVKPMELTIINPRITKTFGRREQLWEGCISSGPGKTGLFAKVPRYQKIKVKFMDGEGKAHHRTFDGLQAHVIQHETDHLNGILFVDRVTDTKSYATYSEYLKRAKKPKP